MLGTYSILVNEEDLPKLIEKRKDVLKFEEIGASMDLTIEVLQNGEFTISSYDCT